MEPTYDIFLSHNRTDKKWVRMLAERIEQETWHHRRLKVFFDEWDIPPGGNIPYHIEQAIPRSRYIAIVLSPDSVDSEWVLLERSIAKYLDPAGKHQSVIPLLLRECQIPPSEGFLRNINFTDPENFENSFQQLLAVLRSEPMPRGSLIEQSSVQPSGIDWDVLVSAIEQDQFTEDPKSHQYGGWSKAYVIHYLPLAFPHQLPPTVSSGDSVTVTHWIVRGLCSLRRIISQSDINSKILVRLERLLMLAKALPYETFRRTRCRCYSNYSRRRNA